MTRIMTNPELIKLGRRPPDSQQLWFVRSELALGPALWTQWTSDILRSGTVIRELRIQAKAVDPAVTLAVEARVFLTNSKIPTLNEGMMAEQVIMWGESLITQRWMSIGVNIDESWLLRKIVTGSDLRLGVQLHGMTVGGVDIRVGVRYEA